MKRLGPTVFIGDFGGSFYALDAKDGSVDWKRSEGGKVFGASTVVGDVVYYSNLGKRNTSGLDVRNGKRVYKRGRGAFSPVISDGKRIYLTTYSSVSALTPVKRPKGQRKKQRRQR